MRTITRTAAALAVAAGVALAPAGIANAAPAGTPAPTACSPENVHSTIQQGDSSAGHRHYMVVMTADPGTTPCRLNGWPTTVGASLDGVPRDVPYPGHNDHQASPVVFGPGLPAQFDVQVANTGGPVPADTLEFTASEDYTSIPGRFVATGAFDLGGDIQVSSIHSSS